MAEVATSAGDSAIRTLVAQAVIAQRKAIRTTDMALRERLLAEARGYMTRARAIPSELDVEDMFLDGVAYGSKHETVRESIDRFKLMAEKVRNELAAEAQIVQHDSCVRAVLKFDQPCTDVNLERTTYRDDLWMWCRKELATLLVAKPNPQSVFSQSGDYLYDWVDAVYSWVSLAFFAANVQPFMLFPKPQSTQETVDGGAGEFLPTRSGLPPRVFNVMSGIRDRLNAAGAQQIVKNDPTSFGGYWFGPTWKGFHAVRIYTQREIESGENPWLLGQFGMETRQLVEGKHGETNGSKHYVGSNYILRALGTSVQNGKVIETPAGLRLFFQYGAHVTDYTIPGAFWQKMSRNSWANNDTAVISPWGIVALADAWAYDVVKVPMMEYVTDSMGWYAFNHLPYFESKGMLGSMTSEEIIDLQRGVRDANIAVKEQKTEMVTQSIMAVAGAIGAAIPGWGTLVAAIVIALAIATQFIAKAIFRRRAPAPECPQPPILRSLSDARCDIANVNAPLSSLTAMNVRFLEAEARESASGGPSEQSFGRGGFAMSVPAGGLDPTTVALGLFIVGAGYFLLKDKR